MNRRTLVLVFLLYSMNGLHSVIGQANYFNAMKWRMIGPHRGGRTVGAVGVPQQPNVFYVGVNNGGVWKTTDYGRTWKPIFDDQPTGSVGDIAVAPSNPNVLYAASGEGIQRPTCPLATGSINQLMPVRPGPIPACAMDSKSAGLPLTPPTKTAYLLRYWGIPTARTKNGECTEQTMAAKPGRKFSTKMKIPARYR